MNLELDGSNPFDAMLIKMKQMRDMKAHDYDDTDGYANIRTSEELGIAPWIGVTLRLNDKMQRLKKFARTGEVKVKDESVLDTFLDVAVYAIIGHIMFEEHSLPLSEGGIIPHDTMQGRIDVL